MSLWRKALGIICLILGVLALITPLTPGAWLIVVGLGILGIEFTMSEDHWLTPWAKRIGLKIKKKPKSS